MIYREVCRKSRWRVRAECRSCRNIFRCFTWQTPGAIVKGDPKEAEAALSYCNPTIVDVLPLTLEEIFIYEMGGADYEVKDILF